MYPLLKRTGKYIHVSSGFFLFVCCPFKQQRRADKQHGEKYMKTKHGENAVGKSRRAEDQCNRRHQHHSNS
jgi:hypothetical protein